MRARNSKHVRGVFLVSLVGWAVSAPAAVLTVDPQGSGLKTIKQALLAAKDGDTIQLADGTYTGLENRGLEFTGRTLTLQSLHGPANCVVNCEGLTFSDDARGLVKGLTITSGTMAIGTDRLTLEDCIFQGPTQPGACTLYIFSGQPTIVNCTFRDLSGTDGGVLSCEGASPILRGCTFENNSASRDGGAIHNRGGSPALTGCRFVNNSSHDDGGAIANFDGGYPSLVACTFERNRSGDNGGAIFSRNGCSPRIVSCLFVGNDSRSNGGAISNRENAASVVNCVFTGNIARDNGGAVYYTRADETPTLLNCTFVGNSADLWGGAVYSEVSDGPELLNCILWANRDEAGQGETSQIFTDGPPLLRYCCVQNWSGQWQGTANHGQDPLFVDPDGPDNLAGTADDNLRLQTTSPCIDTGFAAPVSEPFLTDCDGYPRLTGPALDLGAYEYASAQERAGKTPVYPSLDDIVVAVNEVMTYSPSGPFDWLELHNLTDHTVHLGGWLLSDARRPGLYEIASGTVLEPHGYIVFYEDKHFGNIADPGCRRPFALNNEGETLYLRSGYGGLPTGLRQEQYLEYTLSGTLGRHTNSNGTVDFVRLNTATPGAVNASPWVGPVVISEIMFHRTAAHAGWGYVEVCNTGDTPIAVTGRTYTSGGAFYNWTSFSAPAKSRTLVSDNLSKMQSTYGPSLPTGVQVLQGNLHLETIGDGWPVELYYGLPANEKVGYRHEWVGGDPWPLNATNPRAVTRRDVTAYGNDPNNWQLAAPSPGK